MKGELTRRQQIFADAWIESGNATQSAIKAGCAPAIAPFTASKWLKNPKVAAYIAESLAARQERTKVDQDYVVQRLVIESQREDEGSSHSARVAALSLLGKHLKMFTDKIEHGNANDQPFKVYVGFDPAKV